MFLHLHLGLAIFWLVFGLILQWYWPVLAPRFVVPVSREFVGLGCLLLVVYNFVRWRSACARHRDKRRPHPPRYPPAV